MRLADAFREMIERRLRLTLRQLAPVGPPASAIIGAMATLSRSDVEHVAHLARLGLTDDELTRLEGQLNHILDQYAILAELPPTTSRRPPRRSSSRTSCARTSSGRRCRSRRSSRNAPAREGDFMVVPAILATSAEARRDDRPRRGSSPTRWPRSCAPARSSSRELTEAHLDAAERQNHALNAWLTIDRERALAEADAADARLAAARADGDAALDRAPSAARHPGRAQGPRLASTGGQCTAGSRILEGYLAPYDAHITERLREAGAVILGKTNMDEFAMGSSTEHSAYGPTANPWDLDRVPGGSSGGSAAAVAAFHAPLAIGTDTGGSIRQPAALCGIVGLKPTYGRVSRYGIVAFASSLDQIGPFARDARDAAALLHAIAGRDERDSTSSPEPVPATLTAPAGRATTRRRPASAASAWACRASTSSPAWSRGSRRGSARRSRRSRRPARTSRRSACRTPTTASRPTTSSRPAEASANLARYDGIRYGPRCGDGDVLANYLATRGGGFGPEVKRRIMLGTYALSAGYYDAYYLKAQKVRTLIKRDFDELLAQGFDALVAPTSPTVAFRFGARLADPVAMYLSDACTLPVNMAGLPGVSVPCGLSDGLPVGLQFIGAAWSEAALFGLARGYEAITADGRLATHRACRAGRRADPRPDAGRADARLGRHRRGLTPRRWSRRVHPAPCFRAS